jgi:enolase
LHDRGLSTAVGDEGGFAPTLPGGTEDALDTIKVENAGYKFGDEVMIALDCAAAEFFVDGNDYSKFEGEGKFVLLKSKQKLTTLATTYPIISIEDGMDGRK